jgi:hypothetical protein
MFWGSARLKRFGSGITRRVGDRGKSPGHPSRPSPETVCADGRVRLSQLLELARWLREHEDEAAEIAERGRQLADALTFDHVIDEAVEAIRRHVEAPR